MIYDKLVAEVEKHVPVRKEEFELFVEKLEVKKLKKKEIWETDNSISQYMGFVNEGILRQYYIKDGNEFTDAFYTENDFTGNYISFLSQQPSPTITVALEPCELLVMPFAELGKLSAKIPSVEKFSKIIGDQKLFELNNRSGSLLMDTPEERYQKFIEQKPDLIHRIPQYLIAQYLGIRPESLSRIRKRHLKK